MLNMFKALNFDKGLSWHYFTFLFRDPGGDYTTVTVSYPSLFGILWIPPPPCWNPQGSGYSTKEACHSSKRITAPRKWTRHIDRDAALGVGCVEFLATDAGLQPIGLCGYSALGRNNIVVELLGVQCALDILRQSIDARLAICDCGV